MSLASMNPFKGKTASETKVSETPNKLVSTTGKVASGTVTATKNVASKTTSTIGGWFGRDKAEADPDDPLSLENNPEKLQPDVFVANGQLWESTGNLTKAMESYAKALEAQPNNGPALTSIARLHFREGNYSQSAEYFQKAIAQSPTDAALHNDLGLTLSKLNQHDMAAQTLQRALDLAPGTSRYANNLASVNFESGKTDQAMKVLKANNKTAVAHFNMAFLHYKKGQQAEAQSQLTQALAYEHEASSDPATRRAIDRSRDMLAQLSPGGQLPAGVPSSPTGMPKSNSVPTDIGPAAGPSAIIAAAPAHRTNQSPQVLGQVAPYGIGTVPMTPASYQDPRSYMAPQAAGSPQIAVPSFAPTTPPLAVTPPPAATQTTAPQMQTPASAPPAPSGFTLPGGFQFPSN
jgi:Flp pilus assembly protein TadD